MPVLNQLMSSYIKILKAGGIISAEKDVRVLVSYGLKLNGVDVISRNHNIVSENNRIILDNLIERRRNFEPVAKIICKKDFWTNSFLVNSNVLDPRPESEMLVEKVLRNSDNAKRILDLGTGSGCIAISIALNLDGIEVIGSDISESALRVARYNKRRHNARVNFVKSNWFDNLNGEFDIIVSNPPYLSTKEFDELNLDVKNFDPKIALMAGEKGLDCYTLIASSLSNYLKTGGRAFFEIGMGQLEDVSNIFNNNGFIRHNVWSDLNGHNRVLCVKKDA